MEARHASSARPGAGRPLERAPTSVLGRVCAPGRVILPQPLHHILDPPDLLLDLPVEHLILKQPESRSKDAATKQRPGGSIPTLRRAHTHPSSTRFLTGSLCLFSFPNCGRRGLCRHSKEPS